MKELETHLKVGVNSETRTELNVKKQQEIEMYSDHRFAFPRLCQIMLPTRRAPVELVFHRHVLCLVASRIRIVFMQERIKEGAESQPAASDG